MLRVQRRFFSQTMALMSEHGLAKKGGATLDSAAKRSLDLANFNPNNYNIPVRPVTLDDCMEPYGSWQVAYDAEKRRGNSILFRGIACFTGACLFVYYAGVFDGVLMPNLDNIMEDTQPFELEKGEGRISV